MMEALLHRSALKLGGFLTLHGKHRLELNPERKSHPYTGMDEDNVVSGTWYLLSPR
jgi:hypothetical protein